MTELQKALQAAGLKSITYTDSKTDTVIEVSIEDLPDETIVSQFEYGRRMFNDRLNSMEGNRGDNRGKLEARLRDGWTRSHGGGRRLDSVEREAREVVISLLVQARHKSSEARKLVTADGAETAFREHLKNDDAAWDQVEAHAKRLAAMRAELPDITAAEPSTQ